ncbi:PREDICTED: zinc finger protein ZAT5-like [Ipomoea nil]|uniref:zinc finger protein ZAT5-like n=1 Tax=Ipomoea nil TaxID=35883 RepID=UPI0009019D08|nr:PREDICTED: zinc finger protein ZAT5-like [Ipomoea nil]
MTPPHSSATSEPIPAAPTPEDEDMARCLMILSQGGGVSRHPPAIPKSPLYKEEESGGGSKFCSKKYIETTTVGGGGGTSHTKEKPPLTTVETAAVKRPLSLYDEEDINPYPFNKTPKISPPFSSLHFYDSAKSSPRIHECSYCGAEFSSGQALGGHMRRHRNSTAAAAASQLSPSSSSFEKRVLQKEENNGKGLNLDLNLLPAGEDNQDHRRAREPIVK